LGDQAVTHADGVGDDTRVDLDRQPTGDLLALRAARDEHGRRGDLLDELRQDLGLRGDEVGVVLGIAGHVDLLRAVLRQRCLGAVETLPDEDG
jgi:hypothetical protein